MVVVLYSTNCPRCNVLEKMLDDRDIEFELVTNVDRVVEVGEKNGILSAPILQVDDKVMEFGEAIKWVKEHDNL